MKIRPLFGRLGLSGAPLACSPVLIVPALLFIGLSILIPRWLHTDLPLRSFSELRAILDQKAGGGVPPNSAFYCGDRNNRSVFMSSARAGTEQYFSIPASAWGDEGQRMPYSFLRSSKWIAWEDLSDPTSR